MNRPFNPWDPPPAPDDDPALRRRRMRRAALAMTSVVVLLLALLGASAYVEDQRVERVRAQVAAVLPELRAFVEQERGLPFLEEAEVEVLDDDAFFEALYAEPEDAPAPRGDRDSAATLRALGLLEPEVDLDEAVTDSLDEGVVGFYDPQTGQLAVRGRGFGPFEQLVLVHELVHALQDQHFDIDRPELDESDDERGTAFLALVEGDAVRVEAAWLRAQPLPVQRELLDSFEPGAPSGGEPVVEALLGFPYTAGPGLTQALLDAGGQEALDAAFRDPPTTSEQVVDPVAGPGRDVALPQVEGDVVDEGVLGLLGLALLLDVDPAVPGVERDWDGDRYVTAEDDDGRTCTTAHVAVDDDTTALAAALRVVRPDLEVGPGPNGTLALVGCAS